MTAAFTARDARWRKHLLRELDMALDDDVTLAYVAANAFEGDETSLYLWSFWSTGWGAGYRAGEDDGIDAAFDRVYGRRAADVAARAQARHARRVKPRRRKAKR